MAGTGEIDVEGSFIENRHGHIVCTTHEVHEAFATLKSQGDRASTSTDTFVQPQGIQSSLSRMMWHQQPLIWWYTSAVRYMVGIQGWCFSIWCITQPMDSDNSINIPMFTGSQNWGRCQVTCHSMGMEW